MAKVKKITIVIRSLELGGTETHLLRTIPHVANEEFDVVIFCFERPGELSQKMKTAGVNVVTPPISGWFGHVPIIFKPFTTVWTCVYFLWHLFRRNPDIVHFFLPAAYLLLAPFSLLHRRSKKIMSRRSLNRYLAKYPLLVRDLELFLHKKMAVILANSQAVMKQLIEDESAESSKVKLIYNGIGNPPKTSQSRAETRKKLGIGQDASVLIMVANMLPYKGHEDLIEACSIFSKSDRKVPNWDLIIVGNDSAGIKKNLEHLASHAGIRDKIHFVGKVEDVAPLLAAADIGLLVSHEEGFSNSIIEGMRARLPMIVSDVGGNPEAVLDGITGLVVPSKTPKELASKIEYLLNNPDAATRMGQAAKERVSQSFSIQKSCEAYQAVYKSLSVVE